MTGATTSLEGRTVLVTGAGCGIGRAIALGLAAARRILEPKTIAPLAVFLASPAAGGFAGRVLSADGGYMIGV